MNTEEVAALCYEMDRVATAIEGLTKALHIDYNNTFGEHISEMEELKKK